MLFINDLVGTRAWIAPTPIGYVEPGWAEVVADLLDTLGDIVAASPVTTIDVVDIRERDGRLVCDIVVDPAPDRSIAEAVDDAVAAAMARSTSICARCGAPGRLRLNRPAWPMTRCDDHALQGWRR